MQTSGLLLDVYDDCNGDVLRSVFPSFGDIPGFVKEAHVLSSVERAQLPDDVFALVLVNEGQRLRKYACTDSGNTALSVMYFLENGHKLPEEAQKVAAANLSTACGWYDLDVPVLEKIALVGWAARKAIEHPFTALNVAMSGPALSETAHTIVENNNAIDAIRDNEGGFSGGRPISGKEIDEHRFGKHAEVSGTVLAPTSKASVSPSPTKATVQKSASMKPHVDVTNKTASPKVIEKTAKTYALGNKYPLDSYEQVKKAAAYFDEYGRSFSPEQRREYCQNMLKRAEALNIYVHDDVRHYGGDVFAPEETLKVAHDARRRLLQDEKLAFILDGLFSQRKELGPELYATALSEFDKLAGLEFEYDKDVPDPFFSTFLKQAEAEFSEVIGNDMITEETLRFVSKVGSRALKNTFGEDFMVEFQKDPVGIFKSLPRDQKIVIMRMASDNTGPGIALQS